MFNFRTQECTILLLLFLFIWIEIYDNAVIFKHWMCNLIGIKKGKKKGIYQE